MKRTRLVAILGLLSLFGMGFSVALWRLIDRQTALADSITAADVAISFRSAVYACFGLSVLLALSTLSTCLLFWWRGRQIG